MLPIKKAEIEKVSTVLTESDGDLWPCAWGDDDMLYTANGDGKGFDLSTPWTDIVVNRIEGMPGSLKGERLTGTEGVGPVQPEAYRHGLRRRRSLPGGSKSEQMPGAWDF